MQDDELTARAVAVIPGGVCSGRRRLEPITGHHGARIWSGSRSLVDWWGGAGTALLGANDPELAAAVSKTTNRFGVLPALGVTPPEVELAEAIVSTLPSAEMVQLCATGSEATYHALRLARAATGKPGVLTFDGHYHGWHDQVWPLEPDGNPAPGVLAAVARYTHRVAWGDLDAAANVLRSSAVGAVILEPIMHNGPGVLPPPGFLEGLRELCNATGAVLIFDEMITWPRHAIGGYQSIVGVTPDLTTGAKSLAGGYPVGVLAGSRDLMRQLNTAPGGHVPYSGTYYGYVPACAAGLHTLAALGDGTIHDRINRLGSRMRRGLSEIVTELDAPAVALGYGSIFCLWFTPTVPATQAEVDRGDRDMFLRYRELMHKAGHGMKRDLAGVRCSISAAHNDSHVDSALEATRDALKTILKGS